MIPIVNVPKAGEVYRRDICGHIVFFKEAGGGERVCHIEPVECTEMQNTNPVSAGELNVPYNSFN